MEKDVTNEHESQSSNGLSDDELNSQYFKEFSNFDVMQVKVNFQKSAKTTLHNSWKNIQKCLPPLFVSILLKSNIFVYINKI